MSTPALSLAIIHPWDRPFSPAGIELQGISWAFELPSSLQHPDVLLESSKGLCQHLCRIPPWGSALARSKTCCETQNLSKAHLALLMDRGRSEHFCRRWLFGGNYNKTGWPPPKTQMCFQQAAEAEGPWGTMNLPGAKPPAWHLLPRGSGAGAGAWHPPHTYTHQTRNRLLSPPQNSSSQKKKGSSSLLCSGWLGTSITKRKPQFPLAPATPYQWSDGAGGDSQRFGEVAVDLCSSELGAELTYHFFPPMSCCCTV